MKPEVPDILFAAWEEFGDARTLSAVVEISATVSTNRVYRLVLSDAKELIAKVSSYGAFVHFREDHQRINQWARLLRYSRYRNFLAHVVERDGKVFTFKDGHRWVAFYQKVPFYDLLPRVLSPAEVAAFGRELALFHRASRWAGQHIAPTAKTVGSDIANLYDSLDNAEWCRVRGVTASVQKLLASHCDAFLDALEAVAFHAWPKLPILIDWNTGNFSVGYEGDGFKLFSRWDYDWFRIEPRVFDFYFASRVVRGSGDQTVFSYTTGPLLEQRFVAFLKAYHAILPLSEQEILFLAEAYRFFILNYVVRSGVHFFRPSIWQRLLTEALTEYLPSLASLDLRPLVDELLAPRAESASPTPAPPSAEALSDVIRPPAARVETTAAELPAAVSTPAMSLPATAGPPDEPTKK
jgi:Ser/Thr protein kinase RdoA (MazF antagonist)